jgi:hypothetical protein
VLASCVCVCVCVCTLHFCWVLQAVTFHMYIKFCHDAGQVILGVFGVIVEEHHVRKIILYFVNIFSFVIIKFCYL